MRLRIAHQLSILLACTALAAVVVVGGLSVWNLRTGFSDYLRLKDAEQLTRLTKLVERHAALDPSMGWLRGNRQAMRDLMDESTGQPIRADRPPPALQGEDLRPQMREPRPPPAPPPARPRPNGPGLGGFPDRLVIRDVQGIRLAGREQQARRNLTIRAVKVDGVDVAYLELAEEEAPEGIDAGFLKRQYFGLAAAAIGTTLVTGLLALWLANRWSRPLQAVQRATRLLAQGNRRATLVPAGAREIADLMADVNLLTKELARFENARTLWLAQISHELRTPLAVLRGEFEAIEDGARQPTPQVMASLQSEVMQLVRLVNDLHELAVAQTGGMRCTFAACDADALFTRVVLRHQEQASKAGLELQQAPTTHAPIQVQWDAGRIEQVLGNLMTNSLRYTNNPGRIAVSWLANASEVQLVVEDTSPGVAKEQLPMLFEPLFRGDQSRQRSASGIASSGLGLAIVRGIVLAHGGSVQALASAMGGLRIVVCLPINPQNVQP